jgi:hypothetical protein
MLLRRAVWPKRGRGARGSGGNYIKRSFMIFTPHSVFLVEARVVERKDAYRVLVGKPEGKEITCKASA